MKVKSLSRVRLLATPWTAAHQAPPSMGFSRQEYRSGCHCLPPTPEPLLTLFYFLSLYGWLFYVAHISRMLYSICPFVSGLATLNLKMHTSFDPEITILGICLVRSLKAAVLNAHVSTFSL